MRQKVGKSRLGIVLILGGMLLLFAGVGASLGYVHHEAAKAEEALAAEAAKERSGGLQLDAGVRVSALGVTQDRDLHLQPEALAGAPLPGLSVQRDLDLPLDAAPVELGADLDLAAGSHAKRGVATQGGGVLLADAKPVLGPAESTALAVAAFTGAGLLAYFWATVKAWGTRVLVLPIVTLYAKITRAEVFDNNVRERIFAAIKARPGISASDLSEAAGVSWGTTIYHLDVLEQTRMVTSLREGRYRRYFENGANLDQPKQAVAILQNEVTVRVVEMVRGTPGATQKELARATGMSPQALHWHLARLVGAGLVRKEREGRVVRHFLSRV